MHTTAAATFRPSSRKAAKAPQYLPATNGSTRLAAGSPTSTSRRTPHHPSYPQQLRRQSKPLPWHPVFGLGRRLVVGHVLLGGEQDEGVGPHHLLEREDRLLASDEEGRDHVRKYDEVAQRQHRIDLCFAWRKRWTWWLCSGHGLSFPKTISARSDDAIQTELALQRWWWLLKIKIEASHVKIP